MQQDHGGLAFLIFFIKIITLLSLTNCQADNGTDTYPHSDAQAQSRTDGDSESQLQPDASLEQETNPVQDANTNQDASTDRDNPLDHIPCATKEQGYCIDLVRECAVCPAGHFPATSADECSAPQWCCIPGEPSNNECEQLDGLCISSRSSCPIGWQISDIKCGGIGAQCCKLSPSCEE